MRMKLLAACGIVLFGAVGLGACGDDDNASTTTTASPAASAAATTGTPGPTTTGIAPVDAAIRAVLANDAAALKSQFAFFKVNCSANPSGGIPQPPKCGPGEADGMPVDVFLQSSGEGVYRRPADVASAVAQWLSPGMKLYAVRDRLAADPGTGGYRYELVFVNAGGAGNALGVSEQGIVRVAFDLSRNPALMAEQDGAGKYLIPPQH